MDIRIKTLGDIPRMNVILVSDPEWRRTQCRLFIMESFADFTAKNLNELVSVIRKDFGKITPSGWDWEPDGLKYIVFVANPEDYGKMIEVRELLDANESVATVANHEHGLFTALRTENYSMLKEIWIHSPVDIRINTLGDVMMMYQIIRPGGWKSIQCRRLLTEHFEDFAVDEIVELVKVMRKDQYFGVFVPVEWQPKAPQYLEFWKRHTFLTIEKE